MQAQNEVDGMGFRKGDTVYFSTVSTLVNEGKVIETEGPCIRVETKCPGVEWIWASRAFATKQELRESESYSRDYFSMQNRKAGYLYSHMAEMGF